MPTLRQFVPRVPSKAACKGPSPARPRLYSQAQGEDGIILLAVLFLVILVLIALAVAAPSMARSIQRDKEIELMHRGDQYKRAIKLYYKKFGAYPTSIDQLMNTNQIRFLRKRYKDPITGQDDWRIIHLGEAKVPPMGLFGQPLAGIGAQPNVGTPVGSATGSTFMGTPAGGATGTSSDTGSSAFGTTSGTTTPQSPADGSTSSDTGSSDTGSSSAGFGSSTTNPTSANSGIAGSTSAFGASPTIGGGPIVGVGIPSAKASIIEYKKQKHYNQWEFVYNPIEDQMQSAGLLGGGTQNVNGANPGVTGTGTGNGFGTTNPTSGSGTGSDGGFGGATGGSSSPTDPTQPQ